MSSSHSSRKYPLNGDGRHATLPRSPYVFSAAKAEQRLHNSHATERETLNVRTRTKSASKAGSDAAADQKRSRDAHATTTAEGKRHDMSPVPWNPQATIVPHTSAPLAVRVSIPPLASTTPASLEPPPLRQLSLEEQESAIIEDLLFVFMGFEGQYVRFDTSYNPSEEKDRLAGPSFRILAGLDPSLRDLTMSMLKMATHYIAIEAFLEVQSREEFGAVNHALCASIRKILKDYLVLIVQLEHQKLTSPSFTLHVLNLHIRPTSHMLLQIYTLGLDLLRASSILEDEETDSLSDSEDYSKILERLNRDDGQTSGKQVCKGGSVLGLITKRLIAMSGDPAAKELLTNLLRDSSKPYMNMLNEWLHHGGIKDPHSEFLIKEQKSIRRERLDEDYTDEFWTKRYTIREKLVPPQLEAVQDKVLLAGKYLNVVRECGGVDVSQNLHDVPATFSDPQFLDNVNSAYAFANSSLMRLLLTTHALSARLRSLKHYFFLDRSDFFSYFLELGASELRKPAKTVNVSKLQSLLDIVLRQPGSVAAEDPYKEDVKVLMNDRHYVNWLMTIVNVKGLDPEEATAGRGLSNYSDLLTPAPAPIVAEDKEVIGFDALTLDYAMPFPLSLVVSRPTLTRYQILFRYLLSLRHLETLLVNSWIDHSKVESWRHRSRNPKVEQWKKRAWTLRARMLVFVQQLLYYSTSEVIEPNWVAFMSRLSGKDDGKKARDNWRDSKVPPVAKDAEGLDVNRTVDELIKDHTDFCDTCMKECMLTNSKLLKINAKIFSTCSMFAQYTSLARHIAAADPDLSSPAEGSVAASVASGTSAVANGSKRPTHDPTKLQKLDDLLQKYESNFTKHLKILLDTLNFYAATETVVFLSLCARLSTASVGTSEGIDGVAGVGAETFG